MKNFLLFLVFSCLFTVTTNAQKLTHVQGDILVQISNEANIHRLERNLGTFEGKPTRLKVVKEASKPFRIWLLNFDHTTINEADFLAHVWRQPEVEVAQVNHLISLRQTVPDDTGFNQQWHWVNDGSMGGTADADVDADLAWDLTTGGQTQTGNHEIVVCVVEGANYNHEDLIDNHWVNNAEIPDDGIDNDSNGYVDDYHGWNPAGNNDDVGTGGHGTQVNGMIGAVGNNAQGATGINWDVKIMNVTYANTQEANVIAAYTYPYLMRKEYNESGGARGAFVVSTNASWGIDGGDPDSAPLWCSFYDTLGTVGILNCGATTNQNLDVDAVGDLPTACPSDFMVSVARTGISDNHAGGYGLTQIDFGAPGIDVYTTSGNGGYGTTTGTSFSSPLTAGVIALLYSSPCSAVGSLALTDPEGTALAIRSAIMEGVDVVPAMQGISVTGGRINAFNAMQIIMANCGPCPQPGAVQFTNVIDTSVDVSWASGDSTLTTNLRYRAIGAADWIDVADATNPLTIDGLTACTEYELQLEDICANETSGYTDSVIFTTEGCCAAPTDLAVTNIGETTASVSWTGVFAAVSYNLQLTTPGGTILIENISETTFDLTDLIACEVAGVEVQTVCSNGETTDFTETVFFSTNGCGACEDLPYCAAEGNTEDEFIESIEIGGVENASGSNDGYGNFTGAPFIEMETFGTYDVTLTPGYTGFPFNEVFKIWIDFNQDGEFDDDTEAVFQSDASNEMTTGNMVIPPGAMVGVTRMRINMAWPGNQGNNVPEACQEGHFGEVEDYCVSIIEGMPPVCDAPAFLSITDIDFTTVTLSWSEIANAVGYNIQFREVGAATWTTIESTTNTIMLSNLAVCTEYEFQVETNCVGTTSGYSVIEQFTTACPLPCDDIPTNLDTVAVNENDAMVSWTGTDNAIAYRVRFKEVDATNWFELVTQDVMDELFDLNNCSEYEFQVKAVCEAELESEYSDSYFFETDCLSGIYDLPNGVSDVRIFPNPFQEKFNIVIELEARQDFNLQLLNATGQVVFTENKTLQAGMNDWSIAIENALPTGVYFIRMNGASGQLVRKVVKR